MADVLPPEVKTILSMIPIPGVEQMVTDIINKAQAENVELKRRIDKLERSNNLLADLLADYDKRLKSVEAKYARGLVLAGAC